MASVTETWLQAKRIADFEKLIESVGGSVHPARLSHNDLKKVGIARCTDRKAVLRRTKLFPKPAKAEGGGAAAKAGAAVAATADPVVVGKLESDFAAHAGSIAAIRKELAASKSTIAAVEKAYGIAPPPEPEPAKAAAQKGDKKKASKAKKPAAAAAAALAGTVLKIAADDKVMVALAPFLRSAITVKVDVSEKTAVSGFGPLEGAVAVLSTIASEAPDMLGSTPLERAKVQQWCGWGTSDAVLTVHGEVKTVQALGPLNDHLAKRALVASRSVTIADLVCWAAVRPLLAGMTHMIREKAPHVCRWFNHVQHKQGLESSPLFFCVNSINWRTTEQ